MRDIAEVFDELGIPYRERGANVSSGNVVVRCPWCPDDPSAHLHVSRETGAFYCWRDGSHRGRNPVRLIMKLAGIPYGEARAVLCIDSWKLPEDVRDSIREHRRNVEGLILPDHFRPLWKDSSPQARLFHAFLKRRGFDDPVRLSGVFGLHHCTDGFWAGGLIFPVTVRGVIHTWQARFLFGDQRYVSLSARREIEGYKAKTPIKDLLGCFDQALNGGDVLVVVEGMFDAMKLNWHGADLGLRSVCLFGCSSISEDQEALLIDLMTRFSRLVILFDRGALHHADQIASRVSFLRPRVIPIETVTSADDPGDMSEEDVERLVGAVS